MKFRKRLLSALLIVAVLFSVTPVTLAVAQPAYPDMPADTYWSAAALQNAVANGLLKGSPDGRLLPKANLTRAEMTTVMVRAFGGSVKGDLSAFTDVSATAWYADAMAVAYQMGIVKGAGSLMKPNAPITRQEVFVIVARAMKLLPAETITKTFSDTADLASWAKGETYALVNAGYVEGSDGKLNPKGLITREEFAKIFDNIVKQYIKTAGTYTTASAGNVIIQVPGVTLSNLTISGDSIVGDGVGDGELILDNVVINGRLVIRGGGVNSIIIRGKSSVASVIVARTDGKVSVKVQGNEADVEVVYIDDGSDDVFVEGTVGTLEVAAPNVTVTTVGATIETLSVKAPNAAVVVDTTSKVTNVQVQSAAANAGVTVSGTVTNIATASTNTAIQVSGTVTNVTTTSANTSLNVTGTVANVTTSSTNTTVSGTGTVTKVVAASGASNVAVETPKTKITAEIGSSNVTGGGGTVVDPGTSASNNETGSDATKEDDTTPSGGGTLPPVDDTQTLLVQVGMAGYNVEFAEYSYDPDDDATDVLNGFLAESTTSTLMINALANAIQKAQDRGLIDANGKLLDLTVGSTTVSWKTLLENNYSSYVTKGAALFDSSDSDYQSLIAAIDPDELFNISGNDVYLRSPNTGSFTKSGAANFYYAKFQSIVNLMTTVIESTERNSSLASDQVFYDALGAKLSILVNSIQQNATTPAKCSTAISAIHNGQCSVEYLVNTILNNTDTLSGTLTVDGMLAIIGDSIPTSTFRDALETKAPLDSYNITISIDTDH